VALDGAGNVYAGGTFSGSTDFDPGLGTFDLTSAGADDLFVVKLNQAGDFVWARAMGGPLDEAGDGNNADVAVEVGGNVYSVSSFEGTADFDPGPGTFNLTSAGYDDVIVSKLGPGGEFVWAGRMGSANLNLGYGVALGPAKEVYAAGHYGGAFVAKLRAEADLAVTTSAPKFVTSGQTLTYTTTASNLGPDAASGVVVTQSLPAQSQFLSLSVPAGASCTSPPVGQTGTVACSFSASLASGWQATVTAVVKISAPRNTTVTSTASIGAAEADPNQANNTASVSTRVK
jgi:uncharacterized repeat protein (TIGR01451 family)